MPTIQIQTDSERETQSQAAALALRLRPGDVLALDGPLGSGKTCFVRGLAAGLGLDPAAVSSPTFILLHEYTGDDGPSLLHVDAYRLRGIEELDTIGWEDLLQAGDSIVAVEWAGRIADALPPRRIDIAFAHLNLSARDIAFSAPPELADRIEHLADSVTAHCPACGAEVAPSHETVPFCSARCRLVDLGQWFSGRYRIGRSVEEDDLVE